MLNKHKTGNKCKKNTSIVDNKEFNRW